MAILYLIATPIGTLSDLSPRAKKTLGTTDLVICEDTRHTGKLLAHLGFKKRMESLHNQNEPEKAHRLLQWFEENPTGNAALVTDAGTPAVSDPGAVLVQLARLAGVEIRSIPGPSSLAAALAVCGFQAPRTVFSGFFPRKDGDRQKEIQMWKKAAPCIAVYFESPQRVCSSLEALQAALGPQIQVCVARELSKKFEEHLQGSVEDVRLRCVEKATSLGECVVCVHLPEAFATELPSEAGDLMPGANLRADLKPFAKKWGLSSKDLYEAVQALRSREENTTSGNSQDDF